MARKPKAEKPDPLQWAEKYRARPADNARESVYTTTLAEADAAAAEFEKAGRRPLVEQLYGPVYTVPLERQNR